MERGPWLAGLRESTRAYRYVKGGSLWTIACRVGTRGVFGLLSPADGLQPSSSSPHCSWEAFCPWPGWARKPPPPRSRRSNRGPRPATWRRACAGGEIGIQGNSAPGCPGQHLRPLPRRDHPLQAGVGRGAHCAGHADHRADSLDETRQGPRRVLPASAPCLRGLRQRHRGDDGDPSRGRAGHAGVSPFHAAGHRPRREPQGGERFSHRSSADSQAKGRAQIVG